MQTIYRAYSVENGPNPYLYPECEPLSLREAFNSGRFWRVIDGNREIGEFIGPRTAIEAIDVAFRLGRVMRGAVVDTMQATPQSSIGCMCFTALETHIVS